MSGWIKLEKDLREDLRVKRVAQQLIKSGACNAPALHPAAAVTLVLGALAQLWMHADSFAREDDTLDITSNEIDELTGIQGFAQLLPTDWLEILDPESVKLPGFQEHNGTAAKRKDQTAKRVSKHRAVKRNAPTLPETTPCNAHALPDQTRPRPDQTKEDREARAPRSGLATRIPSDFGLTPERRAIAEAEKADPEREFASFTDHWRAASGAKARKHDWDATWRNWCRRAADFKRPAVNGQPVAPARTWRPDPADDVPQLQDPYARQ